MTAKILALLIWMTATAFILMLTWNYVIVDVLEIKEIGYLQTLICIFSFRLLLTMVPTINVSKYET